MTNIHKDALDWEADKALARARSESRAWKITYISLLFGALGFSSTVFMMPFYKIIPMVFMVDKAKGEAQLVDTTGTLPVSHDQMDKHWLEEYVNTRERYNWMLLQADYDRTMAMSDESVGNNYRSLFDGEQSIDKQLGSHTERRINIISTTLQPSSPGTAVVRFERTTRERGFDTEVAAKYIATISYLYQPPPATVLEKEFVKNPMGFRVIGYVVDKESSSNMIVKKEINQNQQ